MAASPSPAAIKRRIARRLQTFVRQHGGEVKGGLAHGLTEGLAWTKGVAILRASNGEVAGLDEITVGLPGKPQTARSYRFPDLETALLAYRLEEADPLACPDLFEGRPGDYKRLIGRRCPFVQTWGYDYAIGLNLDDGGFDLFTKDGRTLPFRREGADFWAPDLWLNLRAVHAWDHTPRTAAQRHADAEAVDIFCDQFRDEPNWTPTADWRAKPDHYARR